MGICGSKQAKPKAAIKQSSSSHEFNFNAELKFLVKIRNVKGRGLKDVK